MRTTNWARLTSAVAVLASLAACADAPSAPAAGGQPVALAASFDALAQEEALGGALSASEDWHWVATAMRHGIKPSHIEIWTYGKMEEYDAFVRAVEARSIETVPRNEAGHVMLAWQRHNSEVINHALRLWSPGDNGRIVPRSGIHSVPIGAHADYRERGSNLGPWTGFQGIAFVAEEWAGDRCLIDTPAPSGWRPPKGMICQKALFHVRFEATFAPLHDVEPSLSSHTMTMWMAEQRVVGVKLSPAN